MTLPSLFRGLALASAAVTALMTSPAVGASTDFPQNFRTQEIATNGTTIHVRVGGTGPAVLLLHGYGDTGDMWAPLAADLARTHTVIVPDLRGMGLSARADTGFDKVNEAEDIAGVMDALHAPRADVVAHDIGNMVAYALAARHSDRVTKLVLMDAPLPGVGPWDEILKSPLLWHFRFGGPDMERLVAGRERIYLDRFWNEFSADPAHFPEDLRAHYAQLYAAPGRMHAGFRQFAAFDQDAVDNRAWLAAHGKLPMPVLAIGGEKSFGPTMAVVAQAAAIDVEERVIPNSGHWLMEEQPAATVASIHDFLDGHPAAEREGHLGQTALSLDQTQTMPMSGAGAGTSGIRHPHRAAVWRPCQAWPVRARDSRAAEHGDRAPHPPRRPFRHRDFRSLVLRLWLQTGRHAGQAAHDRRPVHRAGWCPALRLHARRTRGRPADRRRPQRHCLRGRNARPLTSNASRTKADHGCSMD